MTRLIDADALTDELIKGIEADTGKSVQTTFTKSVCMILCKAIEQQPTIDAEPHWIPCSERLPEEKGEYLVTYHPCYWDDVKDEIRVGIDTFRGRTTWAKKKHQRVIAWMPLPKPYEVKE